MHYVCFCENVSDADKMQLVALSQRMTKFIQVHFGWMCFFEIVGRQIWLSLFPVVLDTAEHKTQI